MDELRDWLVAKGLVGSAGEGTDGSAEILQRASVIERYLAQAGVPADQARELIAAILRGNAGHTGETAADRLASVVIPLSERRYVTAMFCGFTSAIPPAGWQDPDDVSPDMRRYEDLVVEQVEAFGGCAGGVVGDGVLAYFGFPMAHEDDAVRAISAALSIVANMQRESGDRGQEYDVRIGIATGPVVTGAVAGGLFTEHGAVVGAPPNLAAALHECAEPNGIVVSEQTRALAGSRFVFADLGMRQPRGADSPVACWQPLRRHAVQSRFRALHSGPLGTLVGRGKEMALLDSMWERARAGNGGIIQIRGEAGVGKSRLIDDAFDRTREPDQSRVRIILQCSEYQINEALHPIAGYVEYAAQFGPDDTPEVRLDKLEAFVGPEYPDRDTAVPLIARMLSIPLGGRYPEAEMTPSEFREQLFRFMCAWICELASRRPVIVEVEDTHWSDATTRDFLPVLARAVAASPVLLILTSRPGAPEIFDAKIPYEALELGRLDARAARSLIDELDEGRDVDDATRGRVVARTGGNPLFIEATMRFLREQAQQTGSTGPETGEMLPTTLMETLQSRLDRLEGDKRFAQFIAVLGRRFSRALVMEAWPFDQDAAVRGLDRLLRENLLETRPAAESEEYRFAHALIHEAAYLSLLQPDRARLHRRIAECLETRFPAIAEREPHVLAHHLSAAGEAAAAIPYAVRAANKALTRSAYVEAANHLAGGLALLDQIGQADIRTGLEIELRIPNGAALVAVHGYATPDVEENYSLLLARADAADSDVARFHALLGLSRAAIVRADMRRASGLTDDFLLAADRLDRPELQLTSWLLSGIVQLMCARLAQAERYLAHAIELYDPIAHAGLAHRLGQDPGITAMVWSALCAWLRGDSERAHALRTQALELARRLDHPFTFVYTLVRLAGLDRVSGDVEAMRMLAEEANELAGTHSFPAFAAGTRFWLADAEIARRSDPSLLRKMASEISAHEPTDQRTNISQLLVCLAERAIELNDAETAGRALRQCAAEIEATNVRWCEAELFRLQGVLARLEGREPDIGRNFTRAVALAAGQGAHALELRAAAELVRCVHRTSETDTLQALENACARYPITSADPALAAARELLNRMQG